MCDLHTHPVTFVEQGTAVTHKDGRIVHWDGWVHTAKAAAKARKVLQLRHSQPVFLPSDIPYHDLAE
jgi:hypothetical protein